MKSTYKLIGLYWDRRPEAEITETVSCYDPNYLEVDARPCLFDYVEKKRRINLSELLSVNTSDELIALLEKLSDCDSVAVVLDYEPKAPSFTHRRFVRHRTLQAIESIREVLPETEIVLMHPCANEATK